MVDTDDSGQEIAKPMPAIDEAPAVAPESAEAPKPVRRKAKAAEPAEIEDAQEAPQPAPVEPVLDAAPVPEVVPEVALVPEVVAKPKVKAAPKAKPVRKVISKPAIAAKPTAKPKIAAKKPVKAPKPVAPKAVAAKASAKVAEPKKTTFAGLKFNPFWKESKMDMSATFGGFQEAITGAQAKAKEAFDKSQSVLGEVGDFTKGNVEAVIESGKILAGGMQEIGSTIVTEGRTAFESMTADVKELAAAKSPTDFFKLQSDMMKKSLDSAVAYSSKNSETMLKLMSDVMAPISGRVSIAMEKARSVTV